MEKESTTIEERHKDWLTEPLSTFKFRDLHFKVSEEFKPKLLKRFPNGARGLQNVDEEMLVLIEETDQTVYSCSKSRSQNSRKVLLKSVELQIKFSKLETLIMPQANVLSLEFLEFLEAPHLSCLELFNNEFRTVRPLVKAEFPSLQVLTLYNCEGLRDLSCLSRVQSKKLTEFELDSRVSRQGVDSYAELLKLKSGRVRKLVINSEKRIKLPKLLLKLKVNFKDAKIEQSLPQIDRARRFNRMVLD